MPTPPSPPPQDPPPDTLREERLSTLETLDRLLARPMVVLSALWLVLLVVDLIWGLPPALQTLGDVIWGLFILEFLVSFVLAPDKLTYLRRNWLMVLSLVLPALRILRPFRGLRGLRGLRLLTRLNRGLRSLGRTLRRRLGFMLGVAVLLVLVGAAGMASLEAGQPRAPDSYGEWLYWAGMMLTTIGSDYWPRTDGGRLLTFGLGLFGFSVFGYVTATLASFFVGDDQRREPEEDEVNNEVLRRELRELRGELAAMRRELRGEPPAEG